MTSGIAQAPPDALHRSSWHRRVGLLPVAYLAAIAVIGFTHPFLPTWRWLAIHLLLLGAVSNAIVVWSSHFTVAVLRLPMPASRRAETARLVLLNVGIIGVLAGGATDRPWIGVGGSAVVFAAVSWHLAWLAGRLRAALPAPFSVTVRYYLAACVALLTGIPVGAWMLVDVETKPRLLLFHAQVNLFGWVTLTVLGTLLLLWPTVLRTRLADGAVVAARSALALSATGLVMLGIGVLAWWPLVAVAGLVIFGTAVVSHAWTVVRTARNKSPESFASWSILAAVGWLVVALGVDAWSILSTSDHSVAMDRFSSALMPLLVGFTAQVLLGSLAFLMPVVLGGGPLAVRERSAILNRHWPQRVAMGNAALAVFVLPAPPYVRIMTSMLVLVALLQFLIPAARILISARR